MFHVKIERDEDGFFIATVPALPGCVSDGKTQAEALENVKDAIDGWLWAEDHKAVAMLAETDKKALLDLDLPTYATRQHMAIEAA